jgi:hypothetical protein
MQDLEWYRDRETFEWKTTHGGGAGLKGLRCYVHARVK